MPEKNAALRPIDQLNFGALMCGSGVATLATLASSVLRALHSCACADVAIHLRAAIPRRLAAAVSAVPFSFMEEWSWPWVVAGSTLVGALTRIVFRYRATVVYYREAVSQQASRSTVSTDHAALQQLASMAAAQKLKQALLLHHCLADPAWLPRDDRGGGSQLFDWC